MTLTEAIRAIGKGLYALFIHREPEPFSYIRDVDELTDCTPLPLDEQAQ